MENKLEDLWPILSIADTISGTQARENPQDTIDHYQRLQTQRVLPVATLDIAHRIHYTRCPHCIRTYCL